MRVGAEKICSTFLITLLHVVFFSIMELLQSGDTHVKSDPYDTRRKASFGKQPVVCSPGGESKRVSKSDKHATCIRNRADVSARNVGRLCLLQISANFLCVSLLVHRLTAALIYRPIPLLSVLYHHTLFLLFSRRIILFVSPPQCVMICLLQFSEA